MKTLWTKIKRSGNNTNHSENSTSENGIRNFFVSLISIIIAIIIPLITFFVFRNFFFKSIETLWWRDILSAIIGGLVLSGLSKTVGKTLVSSGTVTYIMLAILVITLVYDYAGKNNERDKVSTEVVVPTFKVITLPLGTTAFRLKAGEETPWLNFPDGIIVDYWVASSRGRNAFVIIYNDGYVKESDYASRETKEASIKIKSKSQAQKITIIVKKQK